MSGPFFPPSAGGGGSADGWSALAFAASGTYFGRTMYKSSASIAVAAGQILQMEAFLHKLSSANITLAVSIDGVNCYEWDIGNDGNQYYGYSNPSFTGLESTGGQGAQNWSGYHHVMAGIAAIDAGPTNTVWGAFDGRPALGMAGDGHVAVIGSVFFYVFTDAIADCSVRARVSAPGLFS